MNFETSIFYRHYNSYFSNKIETNRELMWFMTIEVNDFQINMTKIILKKFYAASGIQKYMLVAIKKEYIIDNTFHCNVIT